MGFSFEDILWSSFSDIQRQSVLESQLVFEKIVFSDLLDLSIVDWHWIWTKLHTHSHGYQFPIEVIPWPMSSLTCSIGWQVHSMWSSGFWTLLDFKWFLFLSWLLMSVFVHCFLIQHRNNILYLVESFQTVIIVGETGCGKTTQIPQVSIILKGAT